MKVTLKLIYTQLITTVSILATALPCFALSRQASLDYLRQWQSLNHQRLQALSTQFHNRPLPATVTTEQLRKQKQECLLRQEFIHQLQFQFVSHYHGQNPKTFLIETLKQMSSREALSNNSDLRLWSFLNSLRRAIRDFPANNKNLLALVEGYTKSSSILEPIKSSEQGDQFQYSNGFRSLQAKAMDSETAGDIAAARILEDSMAAKTKVLELRSQMNEPLKQVETR